MEKKNRENARKLKHITKIPLPSQSLPALSKELVEAVAKKHTEAVAKKHTKTQFQRKRYPLQTLNGPLSLPGPSNQASNITKDGLKFDSKVTIRHTNEDLDWNYEVFKDDSRDNEKIIEISDDNNSVGGQIKSIIDEEQKYDEARALTPALEPSKIKNIKKSLKRPHSRELQGLPALAKHQKNDEHRARGRLSFSEPLAERLTAPNALKQSYMKCLTRDYSSDIFTHLLKEEKKLDMPEVSKIPRACVINWMMKVNGPDGNPATIQIASWYLDAMMGKGQRIIHKIQLISAACYWIARKLQGPGLTASKIVKHSKNAFSTRQLLLAEREVFHELKFPCHPVVPHDFVQYLAWWCDSANPGEIEVGATFLCMCGTMVDKNLCTEYASVIAAAAVKNAVRLLRGKGQLNRLQECPLFQAAKKKSVLWGHVCYILRRSARTVSSDACKHKAPLEQYGTPPYYIAQKILNAIRVFYRTRNSAINLDLE